MYAGQLGALRGPVTGVLICAKPLDPKRNFSYIIPHLPDGPLEVDFVLTSQTLTYTYAPTIFSQFQPIGVYCHESRPSEAIIRRLKHGIIVVSAAGKERWHAA